MATQSPGERPVKNCFQLPGGTAAQLVRCAKRRKPVIKERHPKLIATEPVTGSCLKTAGSQSNSAPWLEKRLPAPPPGGVAVGRTTTGANQGMG